LNQILFPFALFVLCCGRGAAGQDSSQRLEMIGPLQSKKISESSGLIGSHYHTNAWWTMNDSGNGTDVFLFGDKGQTLMECDLKKAKNRDWEAMAGFTHKDQRYLVVADVGDNVGRRVQCELYVFEEPKYDFNKKEKKSQKVSAEKFEFRYEDGARNCEAVASSPDGSAIWLIEKIFLEVKKSRAPGIYKLELPLGQLDSKGDTPVEMLVAKRVGEFPFRGVTGMAISPDGRKLAIRNYLNAHLFQRQTIDGKLATWEETFKNTKPRSVPMPLQVQGEAICFTSDGDHLIVTSEAVRQTVWKVKIASDKESSKP